MHSMTSYYADKALDSGRGCFNGACIAFLHLEMLVTRGIGDRDCNGIRPPGAACNTLRSGGDSRKHSAAGKP
jgi:hypothetical protein